jgi:5-methylcytosine-specific restriction endonuclease McrA
MEEVIQRRAIARKRATLMNTSLTKEQIKQLRKAFRMPAVQSMTSRKTSITNAFVSAIIPVTRPTDEEIAQALSVLGMTADAVSCVYCGDKCNAWDHLQPLVVNRRPTGYISEIANLVPACQPCNSSKGNTAWRDWMSGKASQSPTTRGIQDIQVRIARLEAYEHWRQATLVDFEAIVGQKPYEAYWQELDRIIAEMERSQVIANEVRAKIASARNEWQVTPITPDKLTNNTPLTT